MVRDISGIAGQANTASRPGKNPSQATEAPSNSAPREAVKAPDDVQLSDNVRSLQALSDKVKDLPEVNLERVEQIKLALANGDFKIDELVIAEKILNVESLLNQ